MPVLAVFLMWVEEPRPGTHPAVGGHAAPALSNWPSCCPLSGLLCAGNMLTWREGLTPFSSTTCMWGAIAISHDAPRPRSRGAVQLRPESRAASRWLRPRCTWAPQALSPQLLAAVEPQPSPPRTGRLPPRSWRAACTEIRSASSRGGRAAGGLQARRPSSDDFADSVTPFHSPLPGYARARGRSWLSEHRAPGSLNGFPDAFCLCCHRRKNSLPCGLEGKISGYAFGRPKRAL